MEGDIAFAFNGEVAIIFILLGMANLIKADCWATGCFNQADATPYLTYRDAALNFQTAFIGEEQYLGYDFGTTYGPFQPTVGLSLADSGDVWVGAGAKLKSHADFMGPFFVETSVVPGIYLRDGGPDLGFPVQFRASMGIGYEFNNGAELTTIYDHRSNFNLAELNPGIETFAVQLSIPF